MENTYRSESITTLALFIIIIKIFLVLLVVVSANKKFIMVDVGTNGRISDGGVMYYSKFGELFASRKLNLPPATALSINSEKLPYVFIGDEAFALNKHLMKPYSSNQLMSEEQTVFNKT